MADPFLGEIRLFSFDYAPSGWAKCSGQLLPINQNQGLFSLMGTLYGGNGQTTFALPNLSGRVPIHRSAALIQGQAVGEVAHTVTVAELPAHEHRLQTSTAAAQVGGSLAGLAPASATKEVYAPLQASTTSFPTVASGGSQAHENRMPSLTLNFCVAMQGIFPSQN